MRERQSPGVVSAGATWLGCAHHFESKADLAVRLVERYVAADLAHLNGGLAATAHIEDPSARVVAFLRFYEDGATS